MTDPTNQQELNEKIMRNHSLSGFGMEVASQFPCPFCGEPNWKEVRIIYTEEDMGKLDKCDNCGRSAKFIVTRTENMMTGELVQVEGDDPPEWMTVPIRRVSDAS